MRTTMALDDNLLLTLKKKAAVKKIPFKILVKSLQLKSVFDLNTIGRIADKIEDIEYFD